MRKLLLGTIAALVAGAGGALAQTPLPTPPNPSVSGPGLFSPSGAPPSGMMGEPPMVDPYSIPPNGAMGPGGMPGYPVPGQYGTQSWETPLMEDGFGYNLFDLN